MKPHSEHFRWLTDRLPKPGERRIVVLTGARQTGKTTLVKRKYPGLRYVNLDAIEDREALRSVTTAAWPRLVGPAVLDEAQKEPGVFDKVKHAYDAGTLDFTVLLGSSRFLLLGNVKETLAGRAFLYELWPLLASEVRHDQGSPPTLEPLLARLVRDPWTLADQLQAEPPRLLGADADPLRAAVEHLRDWGGMPELLRLGHDDRKQWLRSYQQTFMERDLADLVRLADLLPFRNLQRLAMLRSASLLNYADLARDAGLSPATARRYLEYMHISYQAFLLPPLLGNPTTALVKAPKLYWADLGLLRQGTGQWTVTTGAMWETLVVSEARKLVDTLGLDADLAFYRTHGGSEVDLVARTPAGVIGCEIKQNKDARGTDARGLRALADHLGTDWRGGLVVYDGDEIRLLDREFDIWAVPFWRLV